MPWNDCMAGVGHFPGAHCVPEAASARHNGHERPPLRYLHDRPSIEPPKEGGSRWEQLLVPAARNRGKYLLRRGAGMPKRSPGPSVKDPEMYEALRDDGASKEKAARISNAAANTSRSAMGRKGGNAGDYDERSKDDLLARARELGIEGRSKMSKAELIEDVQGRAHRRPAQPLTLDTAEAPLRGAAPLQGSDQGRVQLDLGAGERGGDRAAGLRTVGERREILSAQARHGGTDGEDDAGDALANDEGDVSTGVDRGGRGAVVGQRCGQCHGEAGGMCGCDEFLGAGLAFGLRGTGAPVHRDAAEVGVQELDFTLAFGEGAFPMGLRRSNGHVGPAFRRFLPVSFPDGSNAKPRAIPERRPRLNSLAGWARSGDTRQTPGCSS